MDPRVIILINYLYYPPLKYVSINVTCGNFPRKLNYTKYFSANEIYFSHIGNIKYKTTFLAIFFNCQNWDPGIKERNRVFVKNCNFEISKEYAIRLHCRLGIGKFEFVAKIWLPLRMFVVINIRNRKQRKPPNLLCWYRGPVPHHIRWFLGLIVILGTNQKML